MSRRALHCSPARLAVVPAPAATRQVPALTRNERHSLSRTDRARGTLSKKLGGKRIPFIESEWGRRKLRRQKIKAQAEQEFLAHEEDIELRERKRQETLELTASLPALTEQDVEQTYLALMAPVASTSALPSPSVPASPVQLASSDAELIKSLASRLGLQDSLLPARPASSDIVTESQSAPRQLSIVVDALKRAHEERQAVEAALDLSPVVREKRPVGEGLATAAEWLALLRSAQRSDRTREQVSELLSLMQQTGATVDEATCGALIEPLAARGKVDLAEMLLSQLEAAQVSVSARIHHMVLKAHVKAGDLVNAEYYLRTLEERGITPLQESYEVVISGLLDQKLRTNAWNLFSHCRAAAHPTPTESLWVIMIRACLLGRITSSDRALDLWQEMHDQQVERTAESYAAIIRVCASTTSADDYIHSLNLMREMTNLGHVPHIETLQAVLQSAARHADLARARWIFEQIASAVEAGARDMVPNVGALCSLLRAHANFAKQAPLSLTLSKGSNSSKQAAPAVVSHALVEQGGGSRAEAEEAIVNFPGPMPRTKQEVFSSAAAYFERYCEAMGASNVSTRPTTEEADAIEADAPHQLSEPATEDKIFSGMRINPAAVSHFIAAAHTCHRGLEAVVNLHRTLYLRLGIEPNSTSYCEMLGICMQHRRSSGTKAVEHGSKILAQYWRTLGPKVFEVQPGDGTHALAPYDDNTSHIWRIGLQLMAHADQREAIVKLVQRFAILYPPSLTTRFARAVRTSEVRVPAAEIPLASPDYAETSTYHSGPLAPPKLMVSDVKWPLLKLREAGAHEGARYVAGVAAQYQRASRMAERIVRGNEELPEAERGPYDLVSIDQPELGQRAVIEGPPDEPQFEARRRLMGKLNVYSRRVDHPRTIADKGLLLSPETLSRRAVPPPPSRADVAIVTQMQERAALVDDVQ